MKNNKRIAAVIVAAGKGLRMGGDIPKQYLKLCGKPILAHTLEAFVKSCVDGIVVVCPKGDETYVTSEIIGDGHKAGVTVVCGGNERFDSCYAGIVAAMGFEPDYILVHDGVRALVTPELIDRVTEALTDCNVCCPGVPAKDTLRIVDSQAFATQTPNRADVRIIQTPQGFAADTLFEAYRKFNLARANGALTEDITDDAMLTERYTDSKVFIVEGSYENIKITTPEDMLLAEAILQKRK